MAIGVTLSFTPLRKLEGVGASKVATVFLYYMVLTFALAGVQVFFVRYYVSCQS